MNQKLVFEVSWEVCNKVGGIHTVVGTKALSAIKEYGENYILIGPDFERESANIEFLQDDTLLPQWRAAAYAAGIRIRIGRWRVVAGSPMVVLVDFSSFLGYKDEFLAKLWEEYRVDSISGGWDYVEPVIFGYVAARVVESFTQFFPARSSEVVAHFHEWMTCSGALYLKYNSPKIATVFTTHATAVGRSIAGNGLPLYGPMQSYNGDEMAARFGVMAKHSIEKSAAHCADAFTTVSDITAAECSALLDKTPSVVTPNGFEKDFVYKGAEYDTKRAEARKALIEVAEVALSTKFKSEPMIVAISGRYEYKNKGIDEFIDSLAMLKTELGKNKEVLAYIMVPSWHHGARRDLNAILVQGKDTPVDPKNLPNTTHTLGDADNDPVVRHLHDSGLLDSRSAVQVVFVPCYLNGDDGVFNKSYYELLVGCDVSVFPSYYEPWGYTPLESIAFGVPTITTTLAGFGLWVQKYANDAHEGVTVLARSDDNDGEVARGISSTLKYYTTLKAAEMKKVRQKAAKLADIAQWANLFEHYKNTYNIAMENQNQRNQNQGVAEGQYSGGDNAEQVSFISQQAAPGLHPNWTRMVVERAIPERLRTLEELTKNLWWSWNEAARRLFESIDKDKWRDVSRNPIALLDKLSLTELKKLADDADFTTRLDNVFAQYKAYMDARNYGDKPRVAYFSMEYGLHSSLKIYSGGLGILAGDYLKESSDKNVPMVAVGLLYRYGYFTQKLSNAGEQEATYESQNFDKLPITAVRDKNGEWVTVEVSYPGRVVTARVWRCDVGRTELYLMDTDHEMNMPEDRSITHHLYGGDWDNRLKQEFLLGIGGIRVLNNLGIKSDVYHCNEGHAALIGLERSRNFIEEHDLSFSEALEAVRSSSLFTTHTPVPAGHDAFDEGMIRQYMWHYPERLKITWEQFYALGKGTDGKFSMSVLACNLSQEVNGVSWLHGEVSKDILGHMWSGYMPNELHIGYVTNGVHYPTWTADRLKDLYCRTFGEDFGAGDYSREHWDKIYDIPNAELWDARLYLKNRMLNLIRRRVADPTEFRFDSPRQLVQIQEMLNPKALTIGFARRFATYKRAHLLFTNMERLAQIVNNEERPVQFIFAGKAHPADKAGQDLIKRIVEVSKMPQFVGKIIFLQNYDMELARRMVQGVDVWLNTPTRPLEASGTSGEKAVMNGVLQFSVLDGWWVEGYRQDAGWMLPMERTFADQRFQDELDAEMIYTTIEDQIVPTYYEKNEEGHSPKWMEMVKHCVADVASNFTTNRMMQDYEDRFYSKLHVRHVEVIADDFAVAREMAAWKRKVSKEWNNVSVVGIKQFDPIHEAIKEGYKYELEVKVNIAGLSPEDIGVELLVAEASGQEVQTKVHHTQQFEFADVENGVARYKLENEPELSGSYDFAIRVFPSNDKLPHRQDFALVKWV